MNNAGYMKRFFTIAIALFAAGSVAAQETDSVETDTVKTTAETTTIVVTGDGVAITFGDKDKDRTISIGDKDKEKKKKGAFDFGIFNGLDLGFRSEEHTSELQSLMRISYAVFCLKKNKTQYRT